MVLGLNCADDQAIAEAFLKENGVTFPNILDTSPTAYKTQLQYETLGMSAVPLTYLIDRDGKVVDAWYGFDDGHTRGREALKDLGIE